VIDRQNLQLSIHPPSPFVSQNLKRILPDWNSPWMWVVVVVLQRSRFPLTDTAPDIDREKERLRERFIGFGLGVAIELGQRGFLTEIIDPRTGYPVFSTPGEMTHDDVAAVKTLLGFPIREGNCAVIEHPAWETAVYPSILLFAASASAINLTLKKYKDDGRSTISLEIYLQKMFASFLASSHWGT
jgi:hypothetical protein